MTDLERIKKDVVEMDSRANVCWYDTKVLTKAVRLILEELTADRKTEPNNSEIPNNCEHITEDGVTCAKYPACDDCLDNPLNKLKGSERLVKGNNEPTISKMEQVEDEPQTENLFTDREGDVWEWRGDAWYCISGDEPQTDCAWR